MPRPFIVEWRNAYAKADLPGSVKGVGYALAGFWNKDGLSAFPSYEKLMEASGFSRNTVRTAIDVLEKKGWVEVTRGGSQAGRRRKPNYYRATIPPGQQLTGSNDGLARIPGQTVDDTRSTGDINQVNSSPLIVMNSVNSQFSNDLALVRNDINGVIER